MRRESTLQSLRYVAVSGSGIAVNFAIFAILRVCAVPIIACGALAFAVACQHNVTWHARITFGGGARSDCWRSVRFFALSLATLGVNLLILSGLERGGVAPLFAQAAGIAAACPLNFLGSRLWVFAD
jgi:putative flippase GtrA